MGWRDLLQVQDETLVSPWVGGRSLRTYDRVWAIERSLPKEFGWYRFTLSGRKARLGEAVEPTPEALKGVACGFLVGDRFIPEDCASTTRDVSQLSDFEPVHLVELGLPRFVRITVGRFYEGAPLIYRGLEMPLGPEDEVQTAFLDEAGAVDHIAGVVPALDIAFRIETWHREEARKARLEADRQRRLEDARRAQQERRQQIVERLGDGAGRREMALLDFEEAARAALVIGGATLLDQRPSNNLGEMVVQFRLDNRRFECVCDKHTLRIIDAGICLTDERTGRRDDSLLTLESLPGVILEAVRMGVLVIFRHIN